MSFNLFSFLIPPEKQGCIDWQRPVQGSEGDAEAVDDHQHVARDHEVDVDVRRDHFPVDDDHDDDDDSGDGDDDYDGENERIPAGRLREDKLPDNPSVENAPWI